MNAKKEGKVTGEEFLEKEILQAERLLRRK